MDLDGAAQQIDPAWVRRKSQKIINEGRAIISRANRKVGEALPSCQRYTGWVWCNRYNFNFNTKKISPAFLADCMKFPNFSDVHISPFSPSTRYASNNSKVRVKKREARLRIFFIFKRKSTFFDFVEKTGISLVPLREDLPNAVGRFPNKELENVVFINGYPRCLGKNAIAAMRDVRIELEAWFEKTGVKNFLVECNRFPSSQTISLDFQHPFSDDDIKRLRDTPFKPGLKLNLTTHFETKNFRCCHCLEKDHLPKYCPKRQAKMAIIHCKYNTFKYSHVDMLCCKLAASSVVIGTPNNPRPLSKFCTVVYADGFKFNDGREKYLDFIEQHADNEFSVQHLEPSDHANICNDCGIKNCDGKHIFLNPMSIAEAINEQKEAVHAVVSKASGVQSANQQYLNAARNQNPGPPPNQKNSGAVLSVERKTANAAANASTPQTSRTLPSNKAITIGAQSLPSSKPPQSQNTLSFVHHNQFSILPNKDPKVDPNFSLPTKSPNPKTQPVPKAKQGKSGPPSHHSSRFHPYNKDKVDRAIFEAKFVNTKGGPTPSEHEPSLPIRHVEEPTDPPSPSKPSKSVCPDAKISVSNVEKPVPAESIESPEKSGAPPKLQRQKKPPEPEKVEKPPDVSKRLQSGKSHTSTDGKRFSKGNITILITPGDHPKAEAFADKILNGIKFSKGGIQQAVCISAVEAIEKLDANVWITRGKAKYKECLMGDLKGIEAGGSKLTLTWNKKSAKAIEWPHAVLDFVQDGALLTTRKAESPDAFTFGNLNLYSDQDDRVGFHLDREPECARDGRTLILPLKSSRSFYFATGDNPSHRNFIQAELILKQGDALMIPRSFNYGKDLVYHSKGKALESGSHYTIAARCYAPR